MMWSTDMGDDATWLLDLFNWTRVHLRAYTDTRPVQCVAVCCSVWHTLHPPHTAAAPPTIRTYSARMPSCAMCCSVLQCVAHTLSSLYIRSASNNTTYSVCMRCVAVFCSTWQRIAVCCSVTLRCSVSHKLHPPHISAVTHNDTHMLSMHVVCCNIMQCVVVCCSVLQYAVLCCYSPSGVHWLAYVTWWQLLTSFPTDINPWCNKRYAHTQHAALAHAPALGTQSSLLLPLPVYIYVHVYIYIVKWRLLLLLLRKK